MCGGVGGGGANFILVADVGGCREDQGGWLNRMGTSGEAFGCWEEAGGV